MLRHTAELVEQRGVHLRVDVSCTEEQQRLEHRVVHRMEQRTAECNGRNHIITRRLSECSYTQTDEDNAYVLNT